MKLSTLTPYIPLSLGKGEGERICLGDTPKPSPEGACPLWTPRA
jgi:hypothetical protein